MISGGFSMAWRKSSWAKAVFSSSAFLFGSARKKQPYRTRLLLEPLEDRCVPTTIMPTTFADGVLGSGSLRDAVLQFNADSGTDDDTIQLQAGLFPDDPKRRRPSRDSRPDRRPEPDPDQPPLDHPGGRLERRQRHDH